MVNLTTPPPVPTLRTSGVQCTRFSRIFKLLVISTVIVSVSVVRSWSTLASAVAQSTAYNGTSASATLEDAHITLVSAASDNHFCSVLNLIASWNRAGFHPSNTRLLLFDLGISAANRARLENLTTGEGRVLTAVWSFPFNRYPPHVRFNVSSKSRVQRVGQFAWKPLIISDVLAEVGGAVVWFDAGSVIRNRSAFEAEVLTPLLRIGYRVFRSHHLIEYWTHPGMFPHFGLASPAVSLNATSDQRTTRDSQISTALSGPGNGGERGMVDLGETARGRWWKMRNCNGAVVGVSDRPEVMSELVRPWRACALNSDCIAPPGSSIRNHRQDQAALSLLVQLGRLRHRCMNTPNSVLTHQDVPSSTC